MAKRTPKLEEYGPRSMPLIRSTWMTDEQWEAAKKEFDAVTRRMGRPTPWVKRVKKVPACRQCGATGVRLGAASGLCMEGNNCSDQAVNSLLRQYGIK